MQITFGPAAGKLLSNVRGLTPQRVAIGRQTQGEVGVDRASYWSLRYPFRRTNPVTSSSLHGRHLPHLLLRRLR